MKIEKAVLLAAACLLLMGAHIQATETLIEAIGRSKPFVVEQILSGEDPEKYLQETIDDGSGPLHLACRVSDSYLNGNDDGYTIFKILLGAGCCPKKSNNNLETPVHDSCYIKHSERRNEVIEDLLLYGGRLLQEDKNGKTIIERIADLQSTKDLESFLNKFGYLISKEDFKRSIDFVGKQAGQGRGFTDLAALLEKYMNMKKGPKNLIEAILLGDFEGIVTMVGKNPSVVQEREGRWGLSPLMVALLRSDRKIVDFLLGHGAGVLTQDKLGRAALHVVCEGCIEISEKRELVRVLIKHGANKDQVDVKKRTALSVGLRNGLEKELFDYVAIKR